MAAPSSTQQIGPQLRRSRRITHKRLDVWLLDRLIGHLEIGPRGPRFSYEPNVVGEHLGDPLLSTSLPVQAAPFDAGRTRAWFTGLLPEDARLDEVRVFYGLASTDGYAATLQEIGWECAGAVSVLPAGQTPASQAGDVAWLTPRELGQRLSELPRHPYETPRTMRISLGGFQEKMAVVLDPDTRVENGRIRPHRIGRAMDGTPSTHILKPQLARFPGLVRGEAWAMTAASPATEVAEVALLDIDEGPSPRSDTPARDVLSVRRYDRIASPDGAITRIHQEDGAQALGLDPLRKYASESAVSKGDPSLAGIATLLKTYALDPLKELKRLGTQMVVNVALGNTDAHAKNYSLMHPDARSISLSPMYDVVPACEITPGVRHMGMRIAGRILLERIARDDLVVEMRSWGIAARRAHEIVDTTLEALRAGIDHANRLFPQAGARHAHPTLARIERLARD